MPLLENVILKVKAKEEYQNYFESFSLEIDLTLYNSQISDMLSFLKSKESLVSQIEIELLSELYNKLGNEDTLDQILLSFKESSSAFGVFPNK